MKTVLRGTPILAILLLLLAFPLMLLTAQSMAGSAAVEEITPASEKINNIEIMLDNHFATLRGSLYSAAMGYSPIDPKNVWQYQVYKYGDKKYAIGWVVFQDNDSKSFVTNLVFFKEKEPGKVTFISGVTGIDGNVERVMFGKVVEDLPDPVAVVVGSQFVYAGKMESDSGLMNYDTGKSKVARVELMSNRIILTLQNPSDGATSEKFFDWSADPNGSVARRRARSRDRR